MVAGLGDDGPAPGMSNHENRTVLHVYNPMRGRNIVGQRTKKDFELR